MKTAQVYDYTLAALERLIDNAFNDDKYDEVNILASVVDLYGKGLIAVKWKAGEPIFSLVEDYENKISDEC